jgi:hypothetical protein
LHDRAYRYALSCNTSCISDTTDIYCVVWIKLYRLIFYFRGSVELLSVRGPLSVCWVMVECIWGVDVLMIGGEDQNSPSQFSLILRLLTGNPTWTDLRLNSSLQVRRRRATDLAEKYCAEILKIKCFDKMRITIWMYLTMFFKQIHQMFDFVYSSIYARKEILVFRVASNKFTEYNWKSDFVM